MPRISTKTPTHPPLGLLIGPIAGNTIKTNVFLMIPRAACDAHRHLRGALGIAEGPAGWCGRARRVVRATLLGPRQPPR